MPSQLVLLANFLVALALFAVAAREGLVRWLSGRSVTLAVLPHLNAVLLTLYVFGEDSYRGNGISRWDDRRAGHLARCMCSPSLSWLDALRC